MNRLALALAVLLSLNLLTLFLRWLLTTQPVPLVNAGVTGLVCVGIVALTYFTTLDASPHYALYHREAKVYAIAGLTGVVLGLL